MLIARATTAAALALAAGASIAGVVPVDPFGTNQVGTQADGRVLLTLAEPPRREARWLGGHPPAAAPQSGSATASGFVASRTPVASAAITKRLVYEELARHAGVTTSAIRHRVSRGLRALRDHVGEDRR